MCFTSYRLTNKMHTCFSITKICLLIIIWNFNPYLYLTNREALTVLCSVVKHARSGLNTKEVQGETRGLVECLSPLLECSTEHSQGFSICFIVKNPLNSSSISLNFQNQLYFKSEEQYRQYALYFHKARYNKPINIPVRMVQIIWLAVED